MRAPRLPITTSYAYIQNQAASAGSHNNRLFVFTHPLGGGFLESFLFNYSTKTIDYIQKNFNYCFVCDQRKIFFNKKIPIKKPNHSNTDIKIKETIFLFNIEITSYI